MKIRIASLLLALVLIAALLPTPAQASTDSAAEQIKKQITTTYRQASQCAGRSSFNGWCATLVGWQAYLLGIDTVMHCRDGKDEFDMYRYMGGTTSGGYRIQCYSAPQYDLRSALNEITQNGTVDAYNLIVGFERTSTAMGSIYGHAVMIHAILDGQVYYVECYSTSIDGTYYPEGAAISCSIDTFCNNYNRWTVFDGIAYFGVKNYADMCQYYPASMYAMVNANTDTYLEPWDAGVSCSQKAQIPLLAGNMVQVKALLKTPEGNFWYALHDGTYVPAETLTYAAPCYTDLQIQNLNVPTALRKGNGHLIRGIVSSDGCQIDNVTVSVYNPSVDDQTPVMSGSLEGYGSMVDLNNWKLDRHFAFRNLSAGTSRLAMTAKVTTYVLENGEAKPMEATVPLWNSQMRVVADWNPYITVTFDGNGGTAELNRTVLSKSEGLDCMPSATKNGASFIGWSLDKEGTKPLLPDTVFTENTVLYAQYKTGYTGSDGWGYYGDNWVFYESGNVKEGWFTFANMTFYQFVDGSRATQWKYVDGDWHSFTPTGVLADDPTAEVTLDYLNSSSVPPVTIPTVQTVVIPAPVEEPSALGVSALFGISAGLLMGGCVLLVFYLHKKDFFRNLF